MNDLIKEWGAPGIIIIILASYYAIKDKSHGKQIEKMNDDHKEERQDWQRANERQQEESNKNIRENTNILAGLKTLLESRK